MISVKVGNRVLKALLDSGAQPSVINFSCVPIGTPIVKQNLTLKGVKGPPINVCGTADIIMEAGNSIFTQECVVVEDGQLDFPAHSELIIGANCLVQNRLDISTSRWALMKDDSVLEHLHPTRVDGKLFTSAEMDYIEGSNLDVPETELQDRDLWPESQSVSSSEEGEERVTSVKSRKRRKNKFFPKEALRDTNSLPNTGKRDFSPNKSQAELVEYLPALLSVASVANREIPPLNMALVNIDITDGNGLSCPKESLYKLKGGIISPGVILLEGITTPKNNVAIINYNKESFNLTRGFPFTTATELQDDDVMQITAMSEGMAINNSVVYSLMALSSITEDAYVSSAEWASEPDTLEEALRYDPAETPTEEVIYNEERFKRLLTYIHADDWDLDEVQKAAAFDVLFKNQRAFNLPNEYLPKTHLIEHDIELINQDKAVFVKPRWTPIHQRPHIEKEVKGLLQHELAMSTSSKHNSPVVLVRKKDKNKYRLAVDYREVNKQTVPLFYPVTNLEEVVFKVGKCKVISSVDLRQGFHQVGVAPRAQPITAFSCHMGHFMMTRMPFGLSNAPHTMNRLMTMVFEGVTDFTSTFFDDVFIHSNTVEDHLEHLDVALGRLIDANLQASAEKCTFFGSEVSVLGHLAGGGNIKPGLDKLQAIRDFPVPTTRTAVRAYLGLTGFYRKFVQGYALIAKPLTLLTKETQLFQWKEEQQEAFEKLKQVLMKEPVLKAPDFSKPWYVLTDACEIGIGAWLGQRYENTLHPCAYFSRQLRPNELGLKRTVMELECLAVLEALKKFRALIWGQRIVILTDNSALTWLFRNDKYSSPRLTRWALAIGAFNPSVLHYPGALNKVADALSRFPISDEQEQTAQSIWDFSSEDINNLRVNSIISNEQDIEDTGIQQAWTLEQLKKEQREDTLLGKIIQYLLDPSEMNKKYVDPNIKNLEDYFLDDTGILFMRQDDHKATLRPVEEVLVVPSTLQKLAMLLSHDSAIGSHTGPDRTLFTAKRRFFWRNMHNHIKKYVRSCKICQENKGNAHPKQPLRKFPLPDRCFETVSMDLTGPLPLTASGNRYILVVTCFLSRYCVLRAIPNKTADVVAQALWQIICQHGCPTTLYSDGGTEFRNKVMKEMTKNFKVKHVQLAIYHPSSNGLTERKNASIKMALRCFSALPDWDLCLPTAQYATNAAYCSSVGDTPFYIFYHRDAEIPYTRFLKPKFSYAEETNFETDRQKREHLVWTKVKENLLETADRTCRQEAKNRKESRPLEVNDRVFVKRVKKKGESKLVSKWQGPYRILSRKTPNVYKLKDLRTGKTVEHHIENIKGQVFISRESEIPLTQCPEARLPFPVETGEREPQQSETGTKLETGSNIAGNSQHEASPENIILQQVRQTATKKKKKKRKKKMYPDQVQGKRQSARLKSQRR